MSTLLLSFDCVGFWFVYNDLRAEQQISGAGRRGDRLALHAPPRFGCGGCGTHLSRLPLRQGADSPYQGEMSRRDKEGRDAGAVRRLRGLSAGRRTQSVCFTAHCTIPQSASLTAPFTQRSLWCGVKLYSSGSKHSKIPILPSCSAANRSRFLRIVQLTS